ncbi:MAG: hypothetical protein FJ102_26235 [Deltaproteobacteria bacterium]|nr:hypothetical protein [Deltaproteobacteria bacterium]
MPTSDNDATSPAAQLPGASGDYDIPPLPPAPEGATPGERYYGELLQWQTRALDGRLRHSATRASAERAQVNASLGELKAEVKSLGGKVDELDEGKRPGILGRLLAALGRLPQPVQLSLAATIGPVIAAVLYQLSGAAIEAYTGTPPPQVTVPVAVTP